MDSKELADFCIEFCEDRKAKDIIVYDVQGVSSLADYYMFCTGTSDVHIRAIASSIEKGLKDKHQLLPKSDEGSPASGWILVDYADILVHIFNPQLREFYNFEELHADLTVYYQSDGDDLF